MKFADVQRDVADYNKYFKQFYSYSEFHCREECEGAIIIVGVRNKQTGKRLERALSSLMLSQKEWCWEYYERNTMFELIAIAKERFMENPCQS